MRDGEVLHRLTRASAPDPLEATRSVWFPVERNEQRQPTVVCTATVGTGGILPVSSRSRFDLVPAARALIFAQLLFLSECSPALLHSPQIRQTSNSDFTDWYQRSHLDLLKRTLPEELPGETRLKTIFPRWISLLQASKRGFSSSFF